MYKRQDILQDIRELNANSADESTKIKGLVKMLDPKFNPDHYEEARFLGRGTVTTSQMCIRDSSYTDRTRYDMSILTADNIIAGVHKKPLKTCVNEEVNYKKPQMDVESALEELKKAGVDLTDFD